MKFSELSSIYTSNSNDSKSYYKLNDEGSKLLNEYQQFIKSLEDWVAPEAIVNIISVISAEKKGTEKFKTANRLDTLTSGGKTPINMNTVTFNSNDDILNYLT